MNLKDVVEKAVKELEEYAYEINAYEIRSGWSDSEERDLLGDIKSILAPVKEALKKEGE